MFAGIQNDYLGVPHGLDGREGGLPRSVEYRTPTQIGAGGEVIGGDLSMSKEEAARATGLVQEGKASGISAGGLPSGAKDLLATVEGRINKHIDDWAKNYVKSIESAGGSDQDVEQARRMANRIKVAAKELAFKPVQALEQALSDEGEDVSGWRDQKRASIRLWDQRDIEQSMGANPALRDLAGSYGGAANLAQGPVTQLTAGGQTYTVGEESGGWGGQRGPGNRMWGDTQFGRALYGAYILKRAWAMTAGPAFQDVEQYGKYLDTFSGFSGTGDLAAGDAGAAMRQGASDRWWQRGAYEQLGGFQDAAYSFTGMSEAIPRAAAGLRIGGGLLAGGAIAPQLLGRDGHGHGWGGDLAAPDDRRGRDRRTTLGMEAYNALHPDQSPDHNGRRLALGGRQLALPERLLRAARAGAGQGLGDGDVLRLGQSPRVPPGADGEVRDQRSGHPEPHDAPGTGRLPVPG